MTKTIHTNISDLFFNHQNTRYDSAMKQQQEDNKGELLDIDAPEIRTALELDAQDFIDIIAPVVWPDMLPEAQELAQDFLNRL